MEKQFLISFIKKYHLDGKINSTLWSAEDGNLFTSFVTESHDALGLITLKNKLPKGFECEKIPIYTTDRLLKLLQILDDNPSINHQRKCAH